MKHKDIPLIAATGGPGVVTAVLSSGKRGIGAGAGNPPVVVDESAELIKIFIDGATEYEEYSFSALEKEGKDDNYKKVLNLMTKMR